MSAVLQAVYRTTRPDTILPSSPPKDGSSGGKGGRPAIPSDAQLVSSPPFSASNEVTFAYYLPPAVYAGHSGRANSSSSSLSAGKSPKLGASNPPNASQSTGRSSKKVYVLHEESATSEESDDICEKMAVFQNDFMDSLAEALEKMQQHVNSFLTRRIAEDT